MFVHNSASIGSKRALIFKFVSNIKSHTWIIWEQFLNIQEWEWEWLSSRPWQFLKFKWFFKTLQLETRNSWDIQHSLIQSHLLLKFMDNDKFSFLFFQEWFLSVLRILMKLDISWEKHLFKRLGIKDSAFFAQTLKHQIWFSRGPLTLTMLWMCIFFQKDWTYAQSEHLRRMSCVQSWSMPSSFAGLASIKEPWISTSPYWIAFSDVGKHKTPSLLVSWNPMRQSYRLLRSWVDVKLSAATHCHSDVDLAFHAGIYKWQSDTL